MYRIYWGHELMEYKMFYILVEGDNDTLFFQNVVKPIVEGKYYSIMLWRYSQEPKKRVENILKSIKARNADYIYVADIDRAPCVTGKKQEIQDKYDKIDKDKIIVVKKEIESWYLAGLDATISKQLGVSPFDTTDNVTKEQFNDLIPAKFDSRIDFMMEILKHFSIEIAKQKNGSFMYFIKKHDCKV